MTVHEFLLRNETENYIIVTFVNWTVEVLYNYMTAKTDVPDWLDESVIETVETDTSGRVVIEV